MTRPPKPSPAPILPPSEGGSFVRLPDGTLIPEASLPAPTPADTSEETPQ